MTDPKVYASGPDSRGLWYLIYGGSPLCPPAPLERVEALAWTACKVPADKLPRWNAEAGWSNLPRAERGA